MSRPLTLGVTFCALPLLAACLGGGGGGGGTTPTSSSVSTSAPASTTTPPPTSGLTLSAGTYQGWSTQGFNSSGTASSFATSSLQVISPQQISMNIGGTRTGTLTYFQTVNTGSSRVDDYRNSNGNQTVFLVRPNATNSSTPLQFTTFGVWSGNLSGISSSISPVAFGSPTGSANIPSGGSANYIGSAMVRVDSSNGFGQSVTPMRLSANFATGQISGLISAGSDFLFGATGLATPQIDLTNGTINRSSSGFNFSGNATQNGVPGSTGAFRGLFYGPNARELGGTFETRSGVTSIIGSFGARQP